MKTKITKKQLIFPCILLFCALGIYISDSIFSKNPEPNPATSLPTNNAIKTDKDKSPQKPIKVDITANQIWNDELDKIPSPFSVLPTNMGGMRIDPSNTPVMPAISLPPSINMNSIRFPNAGVNTTNLNVAVSSKPSVIIVKAILQGQGGNMAVLGNGSKELVVSKGENSDWGYVSEITDRVVVLNDKTLLLPQ